MVKPYLIDDIQATSQQLAALNNAEKLYQSLFKVYLKCRNQLSQKELDNIEQVLADYRVDCAGL